MGFQKASFLGLTELRIWKSEVLRFLLKILTYPARRYQRRRERLARLARRRTPELSAENRNVRITKKIGDGDFVLIKDFD